MAQSGVWGRFAAGAGAVLLVGIVLGVQSGAPAPPAELPERPDVVRLTLLHTNDLHGQVVDPPHREAGLVALGRAIRKARDEAHERGDDAVLVLDAGDTFKGTPEGDLTDGAVVIAWMNHMGYDALALGNHDLDHGVAVAADLARQASFPFLAGNMIEEASGERPAWLGGHARGRLRGAAAIRDVGDPGDPARVAIVGLTSSAMKDLTVKGITDGYAFRDEAAVLDEVLAALPPVDLTVLLTHCGLETDRELARRFGDRVDLVVGGHSHDRLPEGERVGGVLVVQAGSRAGEVGRVEVVLERAGLDRPRSVTATADLVPAGDDLDEVLEPYVEEVRALADRRIGFLEADLLRVRDGWASSGLGNLQTDLMRRLTGADVALQNKSGIRADLRAGPVTARHVYEVSPFGNTVCTMRLGGDDLRALLEGMLEHPARLLEVSGARVRFDADRPPGERLLELTVGGRPLDPDADYLVATNSFLKDGGDGHEAFTRGVDVRDTKLPLRDLVHEHLEDVEILEPGPVEARLVEVD